MSVAQVIDRAPDLPDEQRCANAALYAVASQDRGSARPNWGGAERKSAGRRAGPGLIPTPSTTAMLKILLCMMKDEYEASSYREDLHPLHSPSGGTEGALAGIP